MDCSYFMDIIVFFFLHYCDIMLLERTGPLGGLVCIKVLVALVTCLDEWCTWACLFLHGWL